MRADFDGERLAVAAGGCVWVGDVDGALTGPPDGRCPTAVTGEGRRQVQRDGSRYAYTFPCLMAPPEGCRGIARYELARRERGRRTVVAVRRFRARLGERVTARFRVPRQRLRGCATVGGRSGCMCRCGRRTHPDGRASARAPSSAYSPNGAERDVSVRAG
jgi:hypothetical protein